MKKSRGNYMMTMTKKGQFKIQQMAFMMVAVTLFFILAGLFYLSIYVKGISREANDQRERKAIINAELFSDSPEFTCGNHCIDTDRLMILKNRTSYRGFWPYASIEIRKVYPLGTGKECQFGNYPECDLYTLVNTPMKNIRKVSHFTALCRKESFHGLVERRCELGKIILGVEIKGVA